MGSEGEQQLFIYGNRTWYETIQLRLPHNGQSMTMQLHYLSALI